MATKNTWQIYAVKGSASNIYFWQLTNLVSGRIHLKPVVSATLDVETSGTSDYNFVWDRYGSDPIEMNIIDVKYIGNGSGTPAYNNVATDLAAILALI